MWLKLHRHNFCMLLWKMNGQKVQLGKMKNCLKQKAILLFRSDWGLLPLTPCKENVTFHQGSISASLIPRDFILFWALWTFQHAFEYHVCFATKWLQSLNQQAPLQLLGEEKEAHWHFALWEDKEPKEYFKLNTKPHSSWQGYCYQVLMWNQWVPQQETMAGWH